MSYWFFLSYAREDNRDLRKDEISGEVRGLVKTFYEDLCREVSSQTGEYQDIGFFDGEEIQPGTEWSKKLDSALQACRVFVSIYSPTYFKKTFCGKEWAIFSARLSEYIKGLPPAQDAPSLILPVLWESEGSVLKNLPGDLSKFQYKTDDYGADYAKYGLRQMMRNKKFEENYLEFVRVLASKIIEAAKMHTLPVPNGLPSIDEIAPVFPVSEAAPAAAAQPAVQEANPRYVKFIFVAAKKNELQGVRTSLSPYGGTGGEWRPWLPDPEDEIDLLVQDVVRQEKLFSEGTIPLDDNLLQQLEAAQSNNRIVVIVVDTWTLRLQPYRKLMREFDEGKQYVNCVIVVPWNSMDAESVDQQQILEDAVQQTFLNRTLNNSPDLLTQIDSVTKMKDRLAAILQVTKSKIIKRAEVLRKAEGNGPLTLQTVKGPGKG